MTGFHYTAITASVGKGGMNHRRDVVAIQQLINAHLPIGLSKLTVDGACGPLTINAISEVERKIGGIAAPDGRLDPGGRTLRAINFGRKILHHRHQEHSAPHQSVVRQNTHSAHLPAYRPSPRVLTSAGPSSADGIPADIVQAAQKAQACWGVPASISIAQWVLESGSGKHMPPGSNNPFGIKAAAGQAAVYVTTREETKDHRSIYIKAGFRKFASMAEAFDEHGKLLATHPAYSLAQSRTNDPDGYADALTHHYATDSLYGTLLKSIMKKKDLYKYNR